MSIATKICNNFVLIVLCSVIIVQLIDILKELTQKIESLSIGEMIYFVKFLMCMHAHAVTAPHNLK